MLRGVLVGACELAILGTTGELRLSDGSGQAPLGGVGSGPDTMGQMGVDRVDALPSTGCTGVKWLSLIFMYSGFTPFRLARVRGDQYF